MHKHIVMTIRSILRDIPESINSDIRASYKRRGGRFSTWNNDDRKHMSEAIFEVENELEHKVRSSGRTGPLIQQQLEIVNTLRTRRNWLLDILGENEYPTNKESKGKQ